jgi:hypothetical protein
MCVHVSVCTRVHWMGTLGNEKSRTRLSQQATASRRPSGRTLPSKDQHGLTGRSPHRPGPHPLEVIHAFARQRNGALGLPVPKWPRLCAFLHLQLQYSQAACQGQRPALRISGPSLWCPPRACPTANDQGRRCRVVGSQRGAGLGQRIEA